MPHPIRPVSLPRAPRRPFSADLKLGDRVRPLIATDAMLVVDLDGPMVTAARRTRDGVSELTLARACFRKVG